MHSTTFFHCTTEAIYAKNRYSVITIRNFPRSAFEVKNYKYEPEGFTASKSLEFKSTSNSKAI